MFEEFNYVNHLGNKFPGVKNGVFVNQNELRDYEWNVEKRNDRITGFSRGIKKRKIPLVVAATTDEEAASAIRKIYEYADKDVLARKPGRIYVGKTYTLGYITKSVKKKYSACSRFCLIELQVTSDTPAWFSEKPFSFFPGGGAVDGGFDYPFDYSYDYLNTAASQSIKNDSIGPSAFKMTIYGPATTPAVFIAGHRYALTDSIGAGESVTIDSLQKTIVYTNSKGVSLNWFSRRDRTSYIFQSIPTGLVSVAYDTTFGFDLTIIEERSEPKWT